MIPPLALPIVRRAILDLLEEIGGEHNHDTLTLQLRSLGHRVAAVRGPPEERVHPPLVELDAGAVLVEHP